MEGNENETTRKKVSKVNYNTSNNNNDNDNDNDNDSNSNSNRNSNSNSNSNSNNSNRRSHGWHRQVRRTMRTVFYKRILNVMQPSFQSVMEN